MSLQVIMTLTYFQSATCNVCSLWESFTSCHKGFHVLTTSCDQYNA